MTVPHADAPRDELWQRYCQALALDPAWLPEDSPRENVSIGAAEATLMRMLNRRLRQSDSLESDAYRRLVRELVVEQTLAQRDGMVRATLPAERLRLGRGGRGGVDRVGRRAPASTSSVT